MLKELSFDRQGRMGFDDRECLSLQFVQIIVDMTNKSLAIIKELDLANKAHQTIAMSILKRSIEICLNLGTNEIMKSKNIEVYP